MKERHILGISLLVSGCLLFAITIVLELNNGEGRDVVRRVISKPDTCADKLIDAEDKLASSVPQRVHLKDGALMVLVPAGPFFFGYPPRERETGAFWIDKYEVSNKQYAQFVAESGHSPPPHWKGKMPPRLIENHPVVNVSWYDATAYAKWAGKRLPTIKEWEKAARGAKDARLYPWGGDQRFPTIKEYGEIALDMGTGRFGAIRGELTSKQLSEYAQVGRGTSPVGSHPKGDSPYGVGDMIGNADEWTASGLVGPMEQITRITRGGGWDSVGIMGNPLSISPIGEIGRYPSVIEDDLGFRCVMDIENEVSE